MAIEIKTEKIWKDEKQYRKILGFKAHNIIDLPEEYSNANKNGGCRCFTNSVNELIIWETAGIYGAHWFCRVDMGIEENDFQRMLRAVYKAGKRLMKINKRIKEKQRKQWSGRQTFKI